jgi:energy-converting hydrogenase Eha subunit E
MVVVVMETKVDMVKDMETMVATVEETILLATVVDLDPDMAGLDLVEATSTMSMAVVAMGMDMVAATDPVMEVGTIALHAEVVMLVLGTEAATVVATVEDTVVAAATVEVGAMEVDMVVVAFLHEADIPAVLRNYENVEA